MNNPQFFEYKIQNKNGLLGRISSDGKNPLPSVNMSDVFPEFLVPQKSMWRSSVMPTEALEEEAKNKWN